MTIKIEDNIPDLIAISCVKEVIRAGKISENGKMYSYATTFLTKLGDITVVTRRYRKSPCFIVYMENK